MLCSVKELQRAKKKNAGKRECEIERGEHKVVICFKVALARDME